MERDDMRHHLILSVVPLPQKRIRLELCTGSVLELNMENRLNTARYALLADETVFRSVTTDGSALLFQTAADTVFHLHLREAVLLAVNPRQNEQEQDSGFSSPLL